MDNTEHLFTLVGIFAQLNGGLLGVVVTLIAVVPTFVEIARSRSPDFLSEKEAQRDLSNALHLLKYDILLFGSGLFLSIGGFFNNQKFLLISIVIITSIGIALLIAASFVVAKTISSIK
jgi:hypothetical protein